MEQYYLIHHGVKGMKWGVRRYQNPDGSYTKAGLRRRKKEIRKARRETVRNRVLLSDKDLEASIERLRKEEQLKSLSTSSGKKATSEVLSKISKTAATGAGIYALSVIGKTAAQASANSSVYGPNLSFWKMAISNIDAGQLGSAIFNGGAKKK